ncbi:hypothetical protein [Streptosporangium vulgare]|uniref:hypothetical protein n=1 Tax=Streptosporangium vulgare TaxID=46190 RepID=UPI0031D8ACF2
MSSGVVPGRESYDIEDITAAVERTPKEWCWSSGRKELMEVFGTRSRSGRSTFTRAQHHVAYARFTVSARARQAGPVRARRSSR